MKLSDISNGFLLYRYSTLLKNIDALYREKKEIEAEIASRKDMLEQAFQKGEIAMERGEGE